MLSYPYFNIMNLDQDDKDSCYERELPTAP